MLNDNSKNDAATALLAKLYEALAFPPGFESPGKFREKPGELRGELKKLVEMIDKR